MTEISNSTTEQSTPEDLKATLEDLKIDVMNPARNQWVEVWNQFKKHRGALIGAIIFFTILFGVVLGPWIYPIDGTYVPSGREFLKLKDTRPIYVLLGQLVHDNNPFYRAALTELSMILQ